MSQKFKILIIENNQDEIKMLGNLLTANGYEALYATSSIQAQKIAANKCPDVVLLNFEFDADGDFSILKGLLGLCRPTIMSVILLVQKGNEEAIEPFRMMEQIDFIYKPLFAPEVIHRIRKQLELRHLLEQTNNFNARLANELKLLKDEINLVANRVAENKNVGHEISELINSITQIIDNISYSDSQIMNESDNDPVSGVFKPCYKDKNTLIGNILLVEDNELNQGLFSSVLKEEGFNVIIAGTGKTAIEEAKKKKPDLILLDITLPDISGYEVLCEMKALGISSPTIVISGYSIDEIKEKFPSIVYNEYMSKPIDLKKLIYNVKKNIAQNNSVTREETGVSKVYDFSKALRISEGSEILVKKWLDEFKELLNTFKNEIELFKNKEIAQIDREITHGVLNYTVYFGANDLKELIWEFRNLQKNGLFDLALKISDQIKIEIISILEFYEMNKLFCEKIDK